MAARLYGVLVRLYPRRFRDEYGADMVQLIRDQCADEPTWRVCARAATDLAITIPVQHMETHMNRTPNHLVPLLYTAIAAAGVLLAISGGTNVAMLLIGACIAAVAGAMAVIAWRRARPIGGTISTGGWWKFVLAGPCIVVVVIGASRLGVNAWFLGVLAILVAFVLTSTGVLLGLVRLTNRTSRTLPT